MEIDMHFKKLFIAICALTISLGPATIFGQETQKEKPPEGGKPKPFTIPPHQTFSLKNGLKVTLVPYGAVPKVTISAVIRSGNINEEADQVWLADLTGEILKEGTATESAEDLAKQTASMGGSLNVNTGVDQTTIATDVLSEFGPAAVKLIADVVEHPLLPASEVDRLKKDFIRQLTISRSQPRPLANERFLKALYPNHPYGRIYPTEEMISSYTIDDVKKFYKANFGADRTHIYVAGRFDAAEMKKAITQSFEGWEKGPAPVMNVPKPVMQKAIYLIDRPGAAQSTVYLGLPVMDPTNPDYVAFQVANSLLGGSFASRITSNIREQKGYTYSPNSQVSTRYRDAYWVEIADVTTAVTGPAIKEIFKEIDRLQNEPPSDQELQGIKNFLAGVFVLQNSSRQGLISQLAFLDLHGLEEKYLTNYVQNVYAVTPKQVQEMVSKYLPDEKMTLVVVGDKGKVEEQVSAFGKINN